MPGISRPNQTWGLVTVALATTLTLAACAPAATPESQDGTEPAETQAGPTDAAFVCGQLNALEAALWRATIDEQKGVLAGDAVDAVQNSVFDGYATIMERAPSDLGKEVAALRESAEADPRDPGAIEDASRALGSACEEAGIAIAILARPGDGG
ncbi:hypothetical protein [Leucobacter aridicollis]|uniref:hypothetical protein n=1 Tax=Leucobacter aridicollis TaxID=283878 RepID=UPI000E65A6A3|nr:hypothetical protein [Leucobacter aridicollis]UTX54202.1 hypothetical protein KI794_05720 [Leucobacter aridicollis]